MESRQIFREKSIERVSSPEQLDDYIKVTTPSVWLILSATIALLAGVCIVFSPGENFEPSGSQKSMLAFAGQLYAFDDYNQGYDILYFKSGKDYSGGIMNDIESGEVIYARQ